MTLELKRKKDNYFKWSSDPYRLGGVEEITCKTQYGEDHFAITIFDTRVFLTSIYEYVKDADSGKMYVENGKWVAGNG